MRWPFPRPNAIYVALVAGLLAAVVTLALIQAQPRTASAPPPMAAAPVDLAVPAGLSGADLNAWCRDRQAQGTAGLSTNAKNWLRGCIEVTNPTATPSPSPTPTPTTPPPTTVPPTTTPPVTTSPVTTPPPTTAPPSPTSTVGWPDATNTGTHGTLTAMACPANGWVDLNTAGQLLENVELHDCTIGIGAPGVIVRNVRDTKTDPVGWLLVVKDGASVTIEDSELSGNGQGTADVQFVVEEQGTSSAVITRVNFHDCADCIQGEHVVLTDSWIHDLADPPGSHVDGFQCNATCDGTVIRHNHIDIGSFGQTGAVSLFQDFGVPTNVIVDNNWLAGGGWTIYGGGGNATSRKGASSNIALTNNQVDPGVFGWLAEWTGGNSNVCTGNHTSAGVPLSCS